MVDGTLYVTSPDNAWALDARDGRELWHYFWRTKGSTPIANRGVGIWNDYLYFVTPDNFFVSLDAKTGKERWNKVHADFDQQYFSTMAPIVVDNHVIVGTGNDLDSPGLHAVVRPGDRRGAVALLYRADEGGRSGARHVAQPRGRASTAAATRGCPASTIRRRSSTSSAPATRFRPTRPAAARATTCTPARWSPSTSTPARWRGTSRPRRTTCTTGIRRRRRSCSTRSINGKPRKLVSTAARNGYFFTLDRVTGEHIVTTKYGDGDQLGQERRQEGLGAARPGQGPDGPRRAGLADLGRHDQLGAAGLLAGHGAVLRRREERLLDLLPDRSRSARLDGPRRQGGSRGGIGGQLPDGDRSRRPARSRGAVRIPGGGRRRRRWPARRRPASWCSPATPAATSSPTTPRRASRCGTRASATSRNAPITYMLDGRQHILVAAGDTLYAFALYE